MLQRIELLVSFLIVFGLLVVYALYWLLLGPIGAQPLGLFMGLLGFLLMVMTETLYTFRKRVAWFRLGPLRLWLSFHIITGIVGPSLALLHSGFSFRGLAGLATMLTLLVAFSGFIGRYIYTAVPRTMNGAIVARKALIAQAARLQVELDQWAGAQPGSVQSLIGQYHVAIVRPEVTSLGLLARFFSKWQARHRLRQALKSLDQVEPQTLLQLESVLRRRQELDWQIASLKTAQRLLRLWHHLHIPLGLTLFTTILFHIGATLYFGALGR